MGFWRKKAEQVINAAYQEAKKSGLRGRAVRRFITKHYPEYGYMTDDGRPLRCKYPYRVWLEVLDALMYQEINGCAQLVIGLDLFEGPGSLQQGAG